MSLEKGSPYYDDEGYSAAQLHQAASGFHQQAAEIQGRVDSGEYHRFRVQRTQLHHAGAACKKHDTMTFGDPPPSPTDCTGCARARAKAVREKPMPAEHESIAMGRSMAQALRENAEHLTQRAHLKASGRAHPELN